MDSEKNTSEVDEKKVNYRKEIFDWALTIVIALLISMVIKAFLFQTFKVNMVSMQDTLYEGQNVIVYKLGYKLSEPKKGDIIVFVYNQGKFKGPFRNLPIPNPGEEDYIKRVIAVPGDIIDIKDGKVLINGKEKEEPYIKGTTYPKSTSFPLTVPEGKLFVMGDNREHSTDSREIGMINRDEVIGKAVFRFWPFNKFGRLK